jgi:UDP-glucose-4-epimerase GalE
MKNILVTGGAGYIGSHTCKKLAESGYQPIVYDNLSRGNRWSVKWGPLIEGDLTDGEKMLGVINEYVPVAVIHFAGYAYVGESVQQPHMYYENNVCGTLSLLNAIVNTSVRKMIFSSSCSTYGIPKKIPINEDHPQNPISPYGHTKLVIEQILKQYQATHNLDSVSLRYFNAAGADSGGEIGEHHVPETHILPRLLDVAIGQTKEIEIYGTDLDTVDGTCVRDYVHVEDIAEAHVKSFEYLESRHGSFAFNIGTGSGFSVKQLISITQRITGAEIDCVNRPPVSGDAPILIADSEKSKGLGWSPIKSGIESIVRDAWNWHKAKDRLIK